MITDCYWLGHPLKIYTVILLPLLSFSARMTVSPPGRRHWDACMEQPYYDRRGANGSGWRQGWYDNQSSLSAKYGRARAAGLQVRSP